MNSPPFDNAIRNRQVGVHVAWHALFWLTAANAVGALIAILLLVPSFNAALGEWTYGHWMMVHMNLELYGWAAIPLLGFLFRAYGADTGQLSAWCRTLLGLWSAALLIGAVSWLNGHSSGKLFLDWTGYARSFFICVLITLWLFLSISVLGNRVGFSRLTPVTKAARIVGLAALAFVPVSLQIVTGPGRYPTINPASGGPTAASQVESTLIVVLILLLVPISLAPRKQDHLRIISVNWMVLLAEAVFSIALGRGDASHHMASQYLGLGCVLIWLWLVPKYYSAFRWNYNTRMWRIAFLWWWGALVITGWIFFLPGVLDHFKFTDGLVGHSFVAMAGFASSFLIFVLVQMLGDDGWILNRSRSFFTWQLSVIGYVVIMTLAGWREGFDPAFTMTPGTYRATLYLLRLVTGLLMLLAATDWLFDCSSLLQVFTKGGRTIYERALPLGTSPVAEKR